MDWRLWAVRGVGAALIIGCVVATQFVSDPTGKMTLAGVAGTIFGWLGFQKPGAQP